MRLLEILRSWLEPEALWHRGAAAEELAAELAARRMTATAYHGGAVVVQNAFMADQPDVIVATTAFGMGIDKPNVRFVYHLDSDGSVDTDTQEIGRAGRDGEVRRLHSFCTRRSSLAPFEAEQARVRTALSLLEDVGALEMLRAGKSSLHAGRGGRGHAGA